MIAYSTVWVCAGSYLVASLLGLLLTLSPAEAAADSLPSVADVARAVSAADFERAQAMALTLLGSGTLQRSQAAALYLDLGLIATARRDPAAAEEAFGRALVLEPESALPAWAGPDTSAVFSRAQQAAEPATLSISIQRLAQPARLSVQVQSSGDVRGLARTVVLDGAGVHEVRALVAGSARFSLPLDEKRACAPIVAGVSDEHGNLLWPELARVGCPEQALLQAQARARSASTRPLTLPIWLTGSFTLAALSTTTVLGAVALHDRADYHRVNVDPQSAVSERETSRSRAEGAETRATIAGITTAVAALATVVLYWTRPAAATAEAHAGLALGPDGVLGRF